jgi:hypothetical protein
LNEAFELDPAELRKRIKSAGFKLEAINVVARVSLRKEGETRLADLGNPSYEVVSNPLADEVLESGQSARLEFLVREAGETIKLEAMRRFEVP